MELAVLNEELAVCRLEERDGVAAWAWEGELVSITRARGELSVICRAAAVPPHARCERGWRALAIITPMDFATTGVAAAITAPLARAAISVLPVATYETDYFLVKADRLADAIDALLRAGHTVVA
jgi:uncharacterized protein